jgi:predicted acyltransferase
MSEAPGAQRIAAVDHFRGLAILLMVLANYFEEVRTVPAWLHHAPDVGYTPSDLVAPLFLFAIGLTYGPSFRRRRRRDGARAAAEHMVVRYLALIGLGLLMTNVEGFTIGNTGHTGWGVLQAIGAAGLLTLPLLSLSPWIRLTGALGLLGLYQGLLAHGALPLVEGASHGGVVGALAWGALLMAATALGDLFQEPRHRALVLWLSLGYLAAGVVLAPWSPVSKNRVSPTYVLVSLGASGLVFLAAHLLDEVWRPRLRVLAAWGKNPLVLYVLHLVLLGVFVLPASPGWYVQAPPWLAATQALALLSVLSAAGLFMEKRGWYVSL